MTDLQWYAYLGGFVAFAIGCYVYYLSRNKSLNDQQVKNRKRVMDICRDWYEKTQNNTGAVLPI